MKKYASIISFFIVALTAYWSLYNQKPTQGSEQNLQGFSVDSAMAHVKNMSELPHFTGSKEHAKVQAYIVDQLSKMGLSPSIQTETVINKKWFAGTTVQNIVARIKGTTNQKALLLLSHYDSNPHSSKGASDAASGVATILEGIRVFLNHHPTPKNDIIILISDAEELGLLGAKAFVEKHPWANDVGLVLNFEARGSGGPSYMLMETNGKNKGLLTAFLEANPGYPSANSLMYSIYKKLPNDTDLTVFRENANINGFNFAFIGDHFDYHSAQDSYERLDRTSLIHQADYLMATLPYFANKNLSTLSSEKDFVYVNFPFIKLLHYPYSWATPLLVVAICILLFLLFFGIVYRRVHGKEILKGLGLSVLSIALLGGVSYALWQAMLVFFPYYSDIQHGFTYNGYSFMGGFIFLSIAMAYALYNKTASHKNMASFLVGPILLWLLINGGVLSSFRGASFLILPVYCALGVLGYLIFKPQKNPNRLIVFSIMAIPTVYIMTPLIKLFPVGLGLKMLFVSAVLVGLTFSLLFPILSGGKAKKGFMRLVSLTSIAFFIHAFFTSGFSEEAKKPNSIVYVYNSSVQQAYWATYNKILDPFTRQFLGENPNKGTIKNALTKSKYNRNFTFYAEAPYKEMSLTALSVLQDTTLQEVRTVSLSMRPTQPLHKLEFTTTGPVSFRKLKVNNAYVNDGKAFSTKKGTFLIYHIAQTDSIIQLELQIPNKDIPEFYVNEISYDLLSHPEFDIKPRTSDMMPMPFVTNDAIIRIRKLPI